MSLSVDEKKRFDWAMGCRSAEIFLMTIAALITIPQQCGNRAV
jgi:hypothetical protein